MEQPTFEFQASYCYARGERYSAGRGLSLMTQDLAQANSVFDTYMREGESYALEIRRTDSGEIIRCAGPSIDEARRSMLSAL
ncbi:hypothetical protein LJR296_007961 [Cupriavidus necator]|uniref:hypothetical protein n=1 Tax=Cupriavidus necator TaxID=106590 RepID=UPI003ED11181